MILTATINEVKRRITFDNPQVVVAVKGDYEVNGVAFAFPAIYEDDFDLSTAVKTVYYKATDGNIYNHIVAETDTDTGYPLWVFKDEINKGAYGDVEFALVCDKVENGAIVKRWVSMITAFRVQKSIEIDEAAQEDNEQTYSERLAYLMTQMANMQATVSGLASGAPTPVSLASAMTDTSKLYVYTGSESGYTAGHWYYYNGSAWTDGGLYGGISVDATLTVSGAAADAKVTGDEIAEIKEDLNSKTGLSEEAKQALLAVVAHIGSWTDEHGQDYYDALEDALYPSAVLTSISAVYTQSKVVYNTATLESLKADLVVTGHYSDGTYRGVSGYTLSGTLTVGTSTITVAYSGKTTTFSVTVTQARVPDGFREVEWIGSGTGNLGVYIGNESFRMPSAFRAEAKAQLTGWNESATYGNILAVFQPNKNTYGYELAYKRDDSTIVSFLGAQSVVTPSDISAEITLGTVCDATNERAYIVVNGERAYGDSAAVSRNYTGAKVGVLAGGNSVLNQFVGKLFYLNIYDSADALVSELIPCYRVSDGVIGLYDAVADGFLTNANDTYTKGADV